MKKETQFVDSPDSDEEEEDSNIDGADWIKHNIRTKVKKDLINEVEANSYGVIQFVGAERNTSAKFVQMSDDTPADIIFNLLTMQWNLVEPQIVISIIGGTRLFKMKEDLKELLSEGLRKITQSPSTWVITGGTNAGIMKFVGEILQDVAKSLIGISTWGVITNNDVLYGGDADFPRDTFVYGVADNLTEYRTFLDHNHPYHLLVDDASKGEYGREIPLVSRLLKYIAHRKDRKAVVLLLEGDFHSLENVIKAVADEQPIPVLVINGSGRAADVLSYAMQCSFEKVHLSLDKIHKGLEDFIAKNMSDSVFNKTILYTKVMECMQHRDMISVVTLNKEEGIDVKILKAIMEYCDLTVEQRLQYTVLWNRVDMAEDLFLDTSIKWKSIFFFDDIMLMALALNRYKFVEYFLAHNINIGNLVSPPIVEFLYGYRSTRKRSTVLHYVDRSSSATEHRRFFTLLKETATMNFDDSANIICWEDIYRLLSSLCKKMNLNDFAIPPDGYFKCEHTSNFPYRDIFLWAVSNNMQDMAKLLWKLHGEQIGKAIVAAEISRKLAEKAEKGNLSDEIIQMLKKNETEFRELALKVLDSCYTESPWKTKVLLTSELSQFSSQNCIRLANESCFQEFIAHKAVQQVLKDLWCGKMRYENHLIKIKDIQKDYHPRSTDPRKQLIDGKNRSYRTYMNRTYMSEDGQYKYTGTYPFDAPVTKFIGSLVSYCIFLMLVSYCAVLKKEDTIPNVIEIIVFVWVVSYAVEEIYQASVTRAPTILQKLQNHLNDLFNIVDLTALTFYFIAFALQLNSSSMEYGHLLYAIDAMLWIVRLLQYFYASKILGTYVIMFGRMFIDMCYFISILVVFLLAYGVLSSAILRPETRIINMIRNIVYFPYFNIYGELFADNDRSPGMTDFGTKVINDYAEPISWGFLGLFLLIANVLLLNLLIAKFGNTFSKVQEKADQIWRFKRHDLITEYALKLSFPPPFTILVCIWKMIVSTRNTYLLQEEETLSRRYSDFDEEMRGFETKNVINVLRMQKTELQKYVINEKREELNDVLKTLQEQITNLNKTTAKMENYLTQMNPQSIND